MIRRKRRAQRVQQIARVIGAWKDGDGLTMYQVAFWCNMKPSTHLMNILSDMETAGILRGHSVKHRPGKYKTVWALTERGEQMSGMSIDVGRDIL